MVWQVLVIPILIFWAILRQNWLLELAEETVFRRYRLCDYSRVHMWELDVSSFHSLVPIEGLK